MSAGQGAALAEGPAAPERVVPLRHPWTWIASAVVLAIAGLVLASVATNPGFEWPVVARYMLDPQILAGLARTLELTVAAMAMGLVLGTAAGGDAALATIRCWRP